MPGLATSCRESSTSDDGHHTRSPISSTSAGTSSVRTSSVSIRTPVAIMNPSSVRKFRGSAASTENVPASTIPAEVITAPVTASPRSIPSRAPNCCVSSRTRAIRKML